MTAPAGEFRLRSVTLDAYLPTLVATIGTGAVMPVLALRARDLGAGVQTAALVVALLGVGQLVSSLPAGLLAQRVGERRALTGAGVLDAVAMVVAAGARTPVALGVAVFVGGAAWTMFLLARQAYLVEVVPLGLRARALALLGGVHRIGLFIGPLLGALLIVGWGMRSVFVLAAVCSLAAGVLAWFTVRDGRSGPGRAAAPQGRGLAAVLRERRGVLATLGVVVIVIAATRGVRASLVPLWADHVGLGARETSVIFGVAAAVDMALFYPAGWVMDRFGRVWIAVPCVAVMALGFGLLPLTAGYAGVLAVSLLLALGNGMGSGIVMTIGADVAPPDARAAFLGAWRLCGDIGTAAGPALVGALAGVVGLTVGCVLTAVALAGGAVWNGVWVSRLDHRLRQEALGVPGAAAGAAPRR